MKAKLICCEVFLREASLAISQSELTVDPDFTEKALHEKSDVLRELIQNKIDETDKKGGYDYILLGFGLCGNSTLGITARSIPLVIPRAHDCCTIFLGSKEKFIENFSDRLSKEWSSAGYMERGDSYLRESDTGKSIGLDKTYEDFVKEYGEESAKFIWESLHPNMHDDSLVYIEIPETSHLGYYEKLKETADKEGKKVELIQGDMRLIKSLIGGKWDDDEFLVIKPGMSIKAVYDHDRIITV